MIVGGQDHVVAAGHALPDHGEYPGSCIQDCHCGDGKCDYTYNENANNCSSDCRCGDHICSAGENSTTCLADCSMEFGYCGDGVCNYHDMGNGKYIKETVSNCSSDCGSGGGALQ